MESLHSFFLSKTKDRLLHFREKRHTCISTLETCVSTPDRNPIPTVSTLVIIIIKPLKIFFYSFDYERKKHTSISSLVVRKKKKFTTSQNKNMIKYLLCIYNLVESKYE